MTEPLAERIAILVHEVRSPVAALAAIAEALAAVDDPVARAELVRLAAGACVAIERIVGDLAVASVRPETMDVGELVRDVAASNALSELRVEAHVEEGLPRVDGDPIRLRQALDNLVANAFVHGGGRAVVVSAARTQAGVSVSVADGGPGIAHEDLGRIFDRGVRLDDEAPGSGLGLSLARAIVVAHGGTIEVASSTGHTVFTITLGTNQSDT